MVHRVFRLSISPERAPEVRRVVDFDGRDSLHDVHCVIQRELELDDDHLYAFYLSGKYFDQASEHGVARDSPRDSQRSLLFRLGLSAGQQLAYLFDFGDEHRHAVTVVSITDTEAPLDEPVLVESVGAAPAQYGDDDEEPFELPAHLTVVLPLAENVLALSDRLDVLYEEEDAKHAATGDAEPTGTPEPTASLLAELAKAALELATVLEEDEEALLDLDEWSGERELLPILLQLPLALMIAGQLESALAVARVFAFVAAESFNADVAIILAESGEHDEALAQLEANRTQFPKSFLTVLKSGTAYEALANATAAEAAYREALLLAEDREEQEEALAQLTGFLEEMGRTDELDELLSPLLDAEPPMAAKQVVAVGRNDPCPCGSGKKYKKCHGV
jgi:tetratricopeptide (TPR) repeat protein